MILIMVGESSISHLYLRMVVAWMDSRKLYVTPVDSRIFRLCHGISKNVKISMKYVKGHVLS